MEKTCVAIDEIYKQPDADASQLQSNKITPHLAEEINSSSNVNFDC
jgi:hypothetical protein